MYIKTYKIGKEVLYCRNKQIVSIIIKFYKLTKKLNYLQIYTYVCYNMFNNLI